MDWGAFFGGLFSGPTGGVLLLAMLLALSIAAPPVRALIREWRGKHGNHVPTTLPPGGLVTRSDLETARLETARVEARVQRYDFLTDEGRRIQEHFAKLHDHAGKLRTLEGEVAHGGRKITAVAEELKEHREKFEEHRLEMAGFCGEQRQVNAQHGKTLEAIAEGIADLKGKAG